MSTPEGVLRAELYMRVLAHRGMPPRGSFQDSIAQEMLLRERRCESAAHIYQAQIVAAGYRLNPAVFDAWTLRYLDEVTHDNYKPHIAKIKRAQLGVFDKHRKVQMSMVQRVDAYTVRSSKDLVPYSPAELEALREKVRKRDLKNATRSTPRLE